MKKIILPLLLVFGLIGTMNAQVFELVLANQGETETFVNGLPSANYDKTGTVTASQWGGTYGAKLDKSSSLTYTATGLTAGKYDVEAVLMVQNIANLSFILDAWSTATGNAGTPILHPTGTSASYVIYTKEVTLPNDGDYTFGIVRGTDGGQLFCNGWKVTAQGGGAAQSDAKEILTFAFAEQTKAASINGNTIDIEVANGTNLANLSAIATISPKASIDTATMKDFSSAPDTLTVTAEDGTTKDWIINVTEGANAQSSEKEILSFAFAQQTGSASINGNTIDIEVANGTNLANIKALVIISPDATIDTATMKDFSSAPDTLTVTAQDGTTKDWIINVTEAAPSLLTVAFNGGNDVNILGGVFPGYGWGGVPIATFSNATKELTFSIKNYDPALDGDTISIQLGRCGMGKAPLAWASDNFTYFFNSDANSQNPPLTPANYSGADTTITIILPIGMMPVANTADYVAGYMWLLQVKTNKIGPEVDGSNNPKQRYANYIIDVNENIALSDAKEIIEFSFAEQASAAVFSPNGDTINIVVANGTDLSNLNAITKVSAVATINTATMTDFSSAPDTLVVTAEDGTTKNWIINVTESAPSLLTVAFNGGNDVNILGGAFPGYGWGGVPIATFDNSTKELTFSIKNYDAALDGDTISIQLGRSGMGKAPLAWASDNFTYFFNSDASSQNPPLTPANYSGADTIIAISLPDGMMPVANTTDYVAGYMWLLQVKTNKIGPEVDGSNKPKERYVNYIIDVTEDITSAANDVVAENVKIYPNPSNGNVNIDLSKLNEDVAVSVIDITGKAVYNNSAASAVITINNLNSGLYLVNIDGKVFKLVVE